MGDGAEAHREMVERGEDQPEEKIMRTDGQPCLNCVHKSQKIAAQDKRIAELEAALSGRTISCICNTKSGDIYMAKQAVINAAIELKIEARFGPNGKITIEARKLDEALIALSRAQDAALKQSREDRP